ncbi:MAG: DUF4255 domain-containing protein [Hyphomicrobiales bacterium]|nr:MAG: DUF4255 domain-containing protein [Hyphomicrobiales bacterium]
MSNALAIAACTATLRNLLLAQIPLLDSELSDLEVTTQPLDIARKNVTKAQLNLFLYQTVVNGAWRNMDMPRQVRPGETGAPALPLNLHYLVTAYGRGESDNDAVSHRVLGGAMSVLHDHPVLSRGEIGDALLHNDLGEQFERLRVTPLPMPLDEMSKLWTVFQTQYRISAAYEVTVLLIDSRAPVKAPLPVLQRGEGDRGVTTVGGLAPSPREIRPPNAQPAARLGEDIAIAGEQLTIADATVRFTNARLAQPIELVPSLGAKPGELHVHLPSKTEDTSALSRWAPGFYTVALVVKKTGVPAMASNEVAFALAPQITVSPTSAAAGTLHLALTCEPRIVEGQRVLLLFGDRQAKPDPFTNPADTTQPTTLAFAIPDVGAGSYMVRLRVDGVDSIPVVLGGTPAVPSFDPLQKVTVA